MQIAEWLNFLLLSTVDCRAVEYWINWKATIIIIMTIIIIIMIGECVIYMVWITINFHLIRNNTTNLSRIICLYTFMWIIFKVKETVGQV